MSERWDPSRATATVAVLGGVCLLCVFAIGGGYAAAGLGDTTTDGDGEVPAFVVDVESDGDAEILVRYTFDLDDESRQAAFEELQTSESERAAFAEQFEDRMTAIAADASTETDREMSVTNATVELETVDETGVVTLSLTWERLAAVTANGLTLTEPFASGFESDRPLHVVFPDGYTIESASPEPGENDAQRVVWNGGTDLTGFGVVATSESDDTAGDTTRSDGSGVDDDGPGFGPFASLAGLGMFLLWRRS